MGEIGVIPALEDFFDRILGRGDAAITVPTFDGSLKPNQLLEHAEVVGEFAEPEDLACIDGVLYLADGLVLRRCEGVSSREVRRFDRPITAFCGLPGGRLAVALDGTEIRVLAAAEGTDAGKVISGGGMRAVNALAAGPDGSLLATDGSANEPCQDWARDLLNRGRSGRLLAVNPDTGEIKVRASGLQYAFGVAAVGQEALVSESWRHRLVTVGANRRGTERVGPAARLSLAHRAGFGRRLLADGVHRKDAAHRVRASRGRIPQADDAGGPAGILGRAAASLGRLVPGADAGGAFEDHGRGQALGAAAVLRAGDPAGGGLLADVLVPQPCRRRESRRGRHGRIERRRSTCLPRGRGGCCVSLYRKQKRRSRA